jgi:2',3'-cyclic-nucleotide 2'-phosphodiesterase/3'-nucleotidase
VVSLSIALDWCEGSARSAGYALAPGRGDPSFRRGLLTGIDFGRGIGRTGTFIFRDSLSRGQAIALVANLRYPSVRVLATTDFHGAILPGRRNNRPIGGSAVLAAWIAALRAEDPEGTVLVDGGDMFQGTMISNLAFGRPVVEQMNALGYTAAAIGNHEFDWTADTLERRVGEMRFAALGANMTQVKDGKRPRWVRSDTLVMRKGVRVGILGLCYPETPTVTLAKNVTHLRFGDDSAAAAAVVPGLRGKGKADVVIGVGHIPGNADSTGRATGDLGRLARGVAGVDAWFGGHSHNRVNGRAERPVPTGRTHRGAQEYIHGQADRIPAMIAGSHGEVISVVDLRVDPVAHRVVDRRQRQVTTYGDRVTPDSAMQARVERWNAGVAAIGAEPVGRNTRRLTRARGTESTVGNLVSDAMRAAVGVDVAFQNSGGLRADLAEGVVTRGSIYEVMPFDNTIVTMELTGAELRRAIEDGLRTGRVHQVSGLRYAFDLGRPAMDRLTSLQGADGAPFDSARTWTVAVNNFMADGGDESSTLARGRNKVDTQVLVRDALERFVRERCAGGGSLDYRTEGRITRSGGD